MAGPLERAYLSVHPGATTGLDLCRFFEAHPDTWFTRTELKAELGCSDRIIREHVPDALNGVATVIEIDRSEPTFRYRYRPA